MALALVLIALALIVLHQAFYSLLSGDSIIKKNLIIFAITVCSAVWNLGHAFMIFAHNTESAESSILISKIGVIFMLPFVTKYILDLFGDYFKHAKKIFYGFLALSAILVPFYFLSDIIVIHAVTDGFAYTSNYNIINILYIAYCLISIITDITLLVLLIKRTQFQRDAYQAKFLLGAFGIAIIMACIGFMAIIPFPMGCFIQFLMVMLICYFSRNYDVVNITASNLLDYLYSYGSTPVIILSHENKVILSNGSATNFFDIDSRQLIGMEITKLFDFENITQEFCKSFTGDAPKFDATKKDSFDTVCLINNIRCTITANYIYDKFDEIICTIFVITDLTDTINLIEQLNESKLEAETSNHAKSAFLANMSHEIRTPMNAIIGMSDILLQRDLDRDVKNYVLSIRNSGNGLLTIINDILDISKIESGKFDIINSEYMLPSLIIDVVNIIFVRLEQKPIAFLVNVNPSLPAFVVGDEMRIKQILLNILSNAVKFTSKGFIKLDVDGEFKDNQLELCFKVSDSGIGIRKQEQDKLFGLFNRVDTRKNRAILGTGLGLSISKNLAELMNGSISVESEYGVGTTFTIKAKQIVIRDTPIAVVENKDDVSIILFETEEIIIESVTKTLAQLDVDFVVVNSEDELVKEISEHRVTHLITNTAVLNIVENALKEKNTETTIIVLLKSGENDGKVIRHKEVHLPFSCIQLADILNNNEIFEHQTDYKEIVVVPMPYAHILVVDDNIVNLEVAKGLMQPYKMKIDTAVSGYEAIEKIQNNEYDLVFMDHMMPDMDGVDTTREIRKLEDGKYADLPIIALTANALSDAKDMFLAEGMNDFMAKPIELSSLNRILKTWVLKKYRNEETEFTTLVEEQVKISGTAQAQEARPYYNVGIVDFYEGKILLGGDVNIYNRVLKTYYEDSLSKQLIINKALEDNEIKLFTTHIHAMKSASANIGAKELSKAAAELEMAGQNNDIEFIRNNMEAFTTMFTCAIAEVKIYLKDFDLLENNDNSAETISDIDHELLEKLKSACEIYSSNEIRTIMNKINESHYDESTMSALKSIQGKIDIFEFEEAIEIIDNLKKV